MRFTWWKREATAPAGEVAAERLPGGASAPAAETAKEERPRYKFPTWLDLLGLVGLYAVTQLLVVLILLLGGGMTWPQEVPEGATDAVRDAVLASNADFNLTAYPLGMGLMILFTLVYRRLRGGNRRMGRYAARGLNPVLILWGLLLMLVTNVVVEPLLRLLPDIPVESYGMGAGMIVTTCLLAPVLEEFLCRGIILDAARAKRGAAYALLFSSIFFAVIHGHPTAVVNALAMGLVLGYVYIRSNSLWLSMILHAFNNALAALAIVAGYQDLSLRELLGSQTAYTLIYALSLAVFAVSGWMVWRKIAALRAEDEKSRAAQ